MTDRDLTVCGPLCDGTWCHKFVQVIMNLGAGAISQNLFKCSSLILVWELIIQDYNCISLGRISEWKPVFIFDFAMLSLTANKRKASCVYKKKSAMILWSWDSVCLLYMGGTLSEISIPSKAGRNSLHAGSVGQKIDISGRCFITHGELSKRVFARL